MVGWLSGASRIVGTESWETLDLEPVGSLFLDPISEVPAEDCELVLRGIFGRCLDVDATIPGLFLTIWARPFFRSSFVVGPPAIPELAGAVDPSRLLSSSSFPNSGGDANRAVGRGPEAEGCLGFFRMGCRILVEDVEDLALGFDSGVKPVAWTTTDLEPEGLGEGYRMINELLATS